MPFLRLSKTKPSSTPNKDDRPLLYATQSSSTPSIAQSTTSTTRHQQEPYFDATSAARSECQRQQPYNDTTSPAPTSEAPQSSQEEKKGQPKPSASDPSFVRPSTPPQGSNHNPWSSYHNLPPDHPVFRYPDEMREKMYAKGVGK